MKHFVGRCALESKLCSNMDWGIVRQLLNVLWGVVKGTFGTFGTAKSLALDEILG